MRLHTARLTVRSLREADIAAYARIVADPAVMRFLSRDGRPQSAADAAAYIHECIALEQRAGYARYAVDLRHSGELIGLCGYKDLHGYIDLGWRYAQAHWNQGYATEAATQVLRHGHAVLGFERIVATALIDNIASIRVMQKLGLRFAGTEQLDWRARSVRYESTHSLNQSSRSLSPCPHPSVLRSC
ncbi:MAG: GNAT family N-acetyltransferase [Panacagrimonas sp.]